jgi:regulator of nonsense transcripts 1
VLIFLLFFSGNEEDYIIISLVRSRGLGFLDNLRRTNVMLTRCKKGMFIITSRKFMDGIGGESLVGELQDCLEDKWGEKVWLTEEQVDQGQISNS